MRGMKEIIFSSKAIQIISQWDEDKIIIVLTNKVDEKSIVKGKEDIKNEGARTLRRES